MNKAWLLVVLMLIAGCVFGPFEIVHKEGHMPKGRINITDNCKFRANEKEGRFICKLVFMPNFVVRD